MPTVRLLPLLALACTALLITACGNEPDSPASPATNEPITDEAVFGTWQVIETSGASPSEAQRFVFSPEGELTYLTAADSVLSVAQYDLVASGQLAITDATGTHLYNYTLSTEGRLEMTEPVEDGQTFRLQRQTEQVTVPPPLPTSTDIPEDSLPADSLAEASE